MPQSSMTTKLWNHEIVVTQSKHVSLYTYIYSTNIFKKRRNINEVMFIIDHTKSSKHCNQSTGGLLTWIPSWMNDLMFNMFQHIKGHESAWIIIPNGMTITSSMAQGGGGSFKSRKPIGEVGCCMLLWSTNGRANALMDWNVVGVVFVGMDAMVAVGLTHNCWM